LVAAWRRLSDVPDDDHAALAWLLGTARRCLANDRRGHTRRLQATERLRGSIRLASADVAGHPAGVADVLMDLADSDREVLTLVYWEDLTVEQVAKVLEISPAAARKRLERARTRLRTRLEASRAGASCEPV
jgi:RNA polymerase sigma-70 factor (ECF subfamily)